MARVCVNLHNIPRESERMGGKAADGSGWLAVGRAAHNRLGRERERERKREI